MGNEYDWQRNNNKGFPYDGDVDNKKYLEDRAQVFEANGNGWWWGWTHHNCPMDSLTPRLKALYATRLNRRQMEKDED
jgi:hypothetical protein|tara:strand:+ start:34 stop:267 length:234 start_codon:yes stop_codon:yes gene_type:complete